MKISACMIAKNEQEMLPRCLDSIKDWIDEIIFVDTGSVDKTMEIAKSYGAKIYEHPWQNDFSFHRNQSIDYATGNWIFIIDCDERVADNIDKDEFKQRLKMVHPDVSALVATITEVNDDRKTTSWLGMRFFRKSSGIHYKNAVHNKAVFTGGCAATDIHMHHYGYSLGKDAMEKKRTRTEELLSERLEKDPKDHAALYYMTQMRVGQKRYDEAEDFGMRFFQCVPVGPDNFQFYGVMYFYMAWIGLHLKDGEKAYAWANKGLEFYPDDIDLNYIMARIGYMSKRDDLLKKHGNKYLALLPSVRNRGFQDSNKFMNEMEIDKWFNRTTYTADESAEMDVRKFMEVLSAEN